MAQPIPCDICELGAADFVVTVVATGEVVGVHGGCILDFAVPVAEAYHAAAGHEPEGDEQSPGSEQPGDEWEDGYPQGPGPKSEEGSPPEGEAVESEDETETSSADVPG